MLKVATLLVLLGAAALTQTAARHTSRPHKGAAGNRTQPATASTSSTTTTTASPSTATTSEAPEIVETTAATEAPQLDASSTSERPQVAETTAPTHAAAATTTTTTEAPPAEASSATERPEVAAALAITTTTTEAPQADAGGTTTESPATDEYNADLAADQDLGESRASDGFEVVDSAPRWLGILYSKRLIYKTTGDYFGGLVILVNDTRAIIHLTTLISCKTPHHMVNGVVMFAYGFGRNVFDPKNSLQRQDTTDIEVGGDDIFGEWFLVGPTERMFYQEKGLIPTQQQLGLTPEIEDDQDAPANDCYLYTYRMRNGLRRLVSYHVIMGKCASTQYYCHFRQNLERHGNTSGVCDGRYDMGAPILCRDKLSYLVGIYDGRKDCGAEFRAVKLSTFHHTIYSSPPAVEFNKTSMEMLKMILKQPMDFLRYTVRSYEDPIMPIQDVGLESAVLKYMVIGAYNVAEKVFG